MYRSGLELNCQCARCGSSVNSELCDYFECEDGYRFDCEDGIMDDEPCPECHGHPIFHQCLSSREFCEANPLPGRESVDRGSIEWYCVLEGRP
jgi:hypothetical protein